MSSAPTESQTYDVDFTREQLWVVHHRLVTLADEAFIDGDQPPEWLVDCFDRIEDGEPTLTARQVTELQSALATYVSHPETPPSDEQAGTAVIERLAEYAD
ncbi:hypothetical protein [Halovivax gelatinilyticus]|uniref:DUF7853 family protein n=1 Tax=Halovivax gelatinilyticus TaxID=2961597 RepID=UPI0020CA45F7|nr:hypothetical protein [Halovivax gelatinilyticus]